jgi:hypothetical protein
MTDHSATSKLDELAKLPDGWGGDHHTQAIDPTAISSARVILSQLSARTDVYPTCDGWVELQWPNLVCVITDDEALIHQRSPFKIHSDCSLKSSLDVNACVEKLRSLLTETLTQ